MNTCAQAFFMDMFSFLYVYTLRSGIAGNSYGNSVFKLLKNCQTVFHMGCTILHSQRLFMRIPVSPHPLRHLFSVFLMLVISVGVRWFGFPFPVILSIFSCALGLFLIFVEEMSA